MWELIVSKIDAWVSHWGSVVFAPKAHSTNAPSLGQMRPGEFFLGAQFLSVFLTFATCIAFFAVYFRSNLVTGFRSDTDKALIATMGTVLFVGLSFVTALLGAACSYGVARALRSRASYSQHLAAFLQLSALDPIVASACGILALAGAGLNLFFLPFTALAFLLSRSWYLYAGYWAMDAINTGAKLRKILAYVVGFGMAFFVFNLCLTGIVWLFVVMMIGGFD